MDTQGQTRYDRQQTAQARNDRNALITGVFGVAVMLLGLYVAATSTDATGGLVIAVLGFVAFIAGMYNRGRKVR